jgi:hypothetical protein
LALRALHSLAVRYPDHARREQLGDLLETIPSGHDLPAFRAATGLLNDSRLRGNAYGTPARVSSAQSNRGARHERDDQGIDRDGERSRHHRLGSRLRRRPRCLQRHARPQAPRRCPVHGFGRRDGRDRRCPRPRRRPGHPGRRP